VCAPIMELHQLENKPQVYILSNMFMGYVV
jgi:hypothetical protein